MKKRIFSIFLLLALCLGMAVPAFAADSGEETGGFADAYNRLQDQAAVITEEEDSEIQQLLDQDSTELKFDLCIVIVESLEGRTARDYADDWYNSCQYGYGSDKDGALLLISTEDRDWAVSTHGYGITAFTDEGIQYLGEQMKGDLSAGNYTEAFRTFARLGSSYVTQAREGNPFDKSDIPRKPLSAVWFLVSVAIGFVTALLIVGSMKQQLKTVRAQAAAGSYVREGSMIVTESKDLFLYHKIERTEKAKNNGSESSTHTSSSGTIHGGGGGKF
ncbi:MAG: TPM domain-containing protein [Bilifractor sp.]